MGWRLLLENASIRGANAAAQHGARRVEIFSAPRRRDSSRDRAGKSHKVRFSVGFCFRSRRPFSWMRNGRLPQADENEFQTRFLERGSRRNLRRRIGELSIPAGKAAIFASKWARD